MDPFTSNNNLNFGQPINMSQNNVFHGPVGSGNNQNLDLNYNIAMNIGPGATQMLPNFAATSYTGIPTGGGYAQGGGYPQGGGMQAPIGGAPYAMPGGYPSPYGQADPMAQYVGGYGPYLVNNGSPGYGMPMPYGMNGINALTPNYSGVQNLSLPYGSVSMGDFTDPFSAGSSGSSDISNIDPATLNALMNGLGNTDPSAYAQAAPSNQNSSIGIVLILLLLVAACSKQKSNTNNNNTVDLSNCKPRVIHNHRHHTTHHTTTTHNNNNNNNTPTNNNTNNNNNNNAVTY